MKYRLYFASFFPLFGLLTFDLEAHRWGALGLLLSCVPFALQFFRSLTVSVYGFWLGAFLLIQSLVSPLWSREYRPLPPNRTIKLDVQCDCFPGIRGPQTIRTDQKGFRTNLHVNYGPKTKKRIIAIGGSTTEEIYLDDSRTWTRRLEEALQKEGTNAEVINTGVAGLRTVHHLSTFEQVLPYQPDVVVFLIGVNDWVRHIMTHRWEQTSLINSVFETVLAHHSFLIRPFWFRKTLLGSFIDQKIHKYGAGLDARERTVNSWEYGIAKDSLQRPEQISFKPETVSSEYAHYLNRLEKKCHDSGVKCLFLTQPNGYSPEARPAYRRHFWMTPPDVSYTADFDSMVHISGLYNRYLRDFTQAKHLPFCDLATFVPPDLNHFYDDIHFNENGAKQVGSFVYECVRKLLSEPSALGAEK